MGKADRGQPLAAPLEERDASIHHRLRDGEDGAEAPGMISASEDWLVPLLLVSMLEGNVYGGQIKNRVEELGFDLSQPGTMYRALRNMEQEGLIISEPIGDAVLLSRLRFEPTEAGEAYLEFWAHSLAQYKKEVERFLRVYGAMDGSGLTYRAMETLQGGA